MTRKNYIITLFENSRLINNYDLIPLSTRHKTLFNPSTALQWRSCFTRDVYRMHLLLKVYDEASRSCQGGLRMCLSQSCSPGLRPTSASHCYIVLGLKANRLDININEESVCVVQIF